MNTNPGSRLFTSILAAAATWLPVGTAMAQETMMNDGMMENGHWYGFGVWLPVLAVVVVGAALYAILRRRQ